VKLALLTCSLLCVSALWGCATSTAIDFDGGLDGATLKDSGNKTDSGNNNNDSGQQGQCPSSCFSDMDCQNSCPAVPNGINCCDTATGICYANASSTCPVPVDAGFD
jgi:hypothetical protein